MNEASIELSYRRPQDGAPIVVIAELPIVRPIDVGGSPTDLRLPGVDPRSTLATISHTYDHFRVESRGVEPVLLNGRPLADGGAELNDGDCIRIREFELAIHEGALPDDPPLLDTPLRWKLRRPMLDEENSFFAGDEASRPYIEEFHLTIRALVQADRYAEIQKRAESEIKRILRIDEAESLDRYLRVLWWTRVRMAREAGDSAATDIAREALDLYPDFAPLMVACGTSLLAARDWGAAELAFTRALNETSAEHIVSRHDARIGRVLAQHFAAAADNAGARPASEWGDNWDVPSIELHSPGDELLLWRMAKYARVFGQPDKVRFVYRGLDPKTDRATALLQRWDIVDAGTSGVFRRVLIVPSVCMADPALVLECHSICDLFSKADREWGKNIIDVSHQTLGNESDENRIPIAFDRSALEALPVQVGSAPAYVRIWCQRTSQTAEEVRLEVVPMPPAGDVVYQQGSIRVAIAPDDARKLAGSQLYFLKQPLGFHLQLSSGKWVVANCAQSPDRAGWIRAPHDRNRFAGNWALSRMLLVAVLLLVALIAGLLYSR